jgi:putative ABC transport system ATP-binding protein
MITLDNITKDYHLGKTKVKAVRGVSLTIKKGEFATLAGPSGSGKTTLLNIIGGLDMPTEGEVTIEGSCLSKLSSKALASFRNKKIGFIFQSFNLLPVLSVYENIELPALLGKNPQKRKCLKPWVEHLCQAVGLKDFMKHKPAELSGGQRQRVAIARALINKPEIVLADEPTANLDTETGLKIIDLMHKLNQIEKTTFLFSTHDPYIIRLSRRLILLRDGKIEEENNYVK